MAISAETMWHSGNLTNKSDQFLVSVKYQPERLGVNTDTSYKQKLTSPVAFYWCVVQTERDNEMFHPYVSCRGSMRGRWWVPTETDEGTSCLGVVLKLNSAKSTQPN